VRLGVLTGGGDCPGLNAVIRAIVRKAETVYHDEVIGFVDGWSGVMRRDLRVLDIRAMRGTLPRGGTVLGTSRVSPYHSEDGVTLVRECFKALQLEAMVVIGGDGTLSIARNLHNDGLPVVGVPKTIDNDISSTEFTFGFNTAVQVATDAIDRLHTTAESHDRVMLVEVMGRHVGWIATYAGIAGGAAAILIPEVPFDIDKLCEMVMGRHRKGRYASVIVVAEGARPVEGTFDVPDEVFDQYGHIKLGGLAHRLAPLIEERTGFETRVTTLGHVQRGGTPTAYDRVLSTRYGVAAIDAAHAGEFGMMVALHSDQITLVPLADAVGRPKKVDPLLYHGVAEIFFG